MAGLTNLILIAVIISIIAAIISTITVITIIRRIGSHFETERSIACRFVPLVEGRIEE